MAWISICPLDQLQEGVGKYVAIAGRQLAVFLHVGRPHVLDNRCPHAGGSLSGGNIQDGCIICPWHAWAFDLQTGRLQYVEHPRVRVYPTRLIERPDQPTMVEADIPETTIERTSFCEM